MFSRCFAAAIVALAIHPALDAEQNAAAQDAAAQNSEDGAWRQYVRPAEVGFDEAALERACAYADSIGSAAIMAVFRGNVLLACGDVARELEAHSVRKSLVSGLYGIAVDRGEIELGVTLQALEIDDDAPLTPEEKAATLRDLISARSGIYLGAAYASSSQDAERPERGSHPPGTNWFYNNWDFNVAGVAYELATGEPLYVSFDSRIAQPLDMQDWSAADGLRIYEPPQSRHPAHTFRISSRDLARFGQLYLQGGRWGDAQVIPADWIEESTRPHSDFGNGTGYGYMWWTYEPGSLGDNYPALNRHDLYMGRGTGGQALWVIPGADMVIVHRGDTDNGREIAGADAWGIAEMIVAAHASNRPPNPVAAADANADADSVADPVPEPGAGSDPELTALNPTPFESQLPPLDLEYLAVPDSLFTQIEGQYELAPGAILRIYEWNDRPFVHMPGEGDAELYMLSDGALTVRVVTGVRVEFERDAEGEVTALTGSLGPQQFTGRKLLPGQ